MSRTGFFGSESKGIVSNGCVLGPHVAPGRFFHELGWVVLGVGFPDFPGFPPRFPGKWCQNGRSMALKRMSLYCIRVTGFLAVSEHQRMAVAGHLLREISPIRGFGPKRGKNGPFRGPPKHPPTPDLPTGISMPRMCRHGLILALTASKRPFRFQISTASSVPDPGSGSKSRFFNRRSAGAEPVGFGISTLSGARFHPGVGPGGRDQKVARTTPRPPQKRHPRGQNTPQKGVSGPPGRSRSAVRARQKAGPGGREFGPERCRGVVSDAFGPVSGSFAYSTACGARGLYYAVDGHSCVHFLSSQTRKSIFSTPGRHLMAKYDFYSHHGVHSRSYLMVRWGPGVEKSTFSN